MGPNDMSCQACSSVAVLLQLVYPAAQGDSDVEAFEQEVAAAQARVRREEAAERASRAPSSRLSSLAGDSPPGSPGRRQHKT